MQQNMERKRFVLERFHVCPFLLRQRMVSAAKSDRPVYRYVFACPGEAEVLVRCCIIFNVDVGHAKIIKSLFLN